MMSRIFRAAALLATLAVLFPAAGCIRYQEELIVLPDGSGKMTLHMGFNLEILDKLKEMGMDPKEDDGKMEFDAKDLEDFEGIVAITKPKHEKKDNWQTWTVTAYFDDINKVKLYQKGDNRDEERKLKVSFAFKKEGEGYVLDIDDRLMESDDTKKMDDMPEEGAEQAWEMVKQFLKGFEVSRGVKMPGAVTTVEGFAKKEGRGASNRIDEASIKGMSDLTKMSKASKRKVACGKSEMSEGDVAAFKKELDDAKAAWPKIQEEMKAEAEKKRKDKEKEEE